jgi:glycosyltransferase involved in cell wall biosynthesis
MARIFSTYPWTRPTWRCRADVLESDLSGFRRLLGTLRALKSYDVLVLDGFERGDLVAAAVVARMRRPPRVIILDPTWKLDGSPVARRATRAIVSALDGAHVTYGVLSRFEVDSFPKTWGVSANRVVFLPWHFDLSEDELRTPSSTNGPFFAGGDSLRDYGTALAAAAHVPARLVIATRAIPANGVSIPANVTVGPESRQQYDLLLREAIAVVLPLEVRADRSSGQGTLLNAMAHGKTVIVTDSPGVRDYLRPNETALVVSPGDPAALRAAMQWVLDHPDESGRIARNARKDVLTRFGPDLYLQRLVDLIDGQTSQWFGT